MNQDVFFYVSSHGYEFPHESLGSRGTTLFTQPGGVATLEMNRLNIAERLYRITGQGIYRDSVKLGLPVPIDEPSLNGRVMGSDSTQAMVYNGKIYWFWGDTLGPFHPLGNFRTTGAVSDLPGQGGLPPDQGVNLTYFTRDDGFVKEMVPKLPGDTTIVWIAGLTTVPDEDGRERLVAGYANMASLENVVERGVVIFDDQEEQFSGRVKFALADPNRDWQYPGGQAARYVDGDTEYRVFAEPWPVKRVKATLADLTDMNQYEAFTPLKPGTVFRGADTELERDANGNLVYGWKKNTPPITQSQEKELINRGLMSEQEARFQLKEADTGKEVLIQASSVAWNEYRKKWILIGEQSFGESSFLGEIWYAEAPSPTGPWEKAKKIVTHNNYSFYNPIHHVHFDEDNGRVIYFEATYTATFTDSEPTPYYDYNQIMYRLELDNPALFP
jgi:hypothetical protein